MNQNHVQKTELRPTKVKSNAKDVKLKRWITKEFITFQIAYGLNASNACNLVLNQMVSVTLSVRLVHDVILIQKVIINAPNACQEPTTIFPAQILAKPAYLEIIARRLGWQI